MSIFELIKREICIFYTFIMYMSFVFGFINLIMLNFILAITCLIGGSVLRFVPWFVNKQLNENMKD